MSAQDIEYSEDKTPAENVAALVRMAYAIEVKTPADMTAAELCEQLEIRDKLVTCLRAEVKCQVEAYNRLLEENNRLSRDVQAPDTAARSPRRNKTTPL